MPFKLDVDRLHKDELIWELRSRGIAESDNVDALRKSLRSALSLEKDASFNQPIPFEGDASEELNICQTKLNDITEFLTTFSGSVGQVRRLETKICHTYNRLERITSDDPDLMCKRAVLRKGLMEMISVYNSKNLALKPVQQNVLTDLRLQDIPPSTSGNTETHSPPPVTSSPRVPPIPNNDLNLNNSFNVNSSFTVPVYKWQIKFSGLPTESFNSFLEEVEEHCISRNVNKANLFSSARDLFAGDALRMYNWFKRYASDWDSLIKLMKEEYVPSADKLWQQILSRTQGASESIGLYVAIMTSLFDRMPTHVSDSLRMQVLRRNILPFFQERLALTEIRSPFELIELCRKIEEIRESVDNFKPPNLSSLSLEPDLAYKGSPRQSRPTVNEIQIREQTCWRCKTPGHFAKDCPKRKHDFRCFGCGKEGFTKNSCPNCNPNRNSRSRNEPSTSESSRNNQNTRTSGSGNATQRR